MNLDVFETSSSIILTLVLFLLKDVVPFVRKIADHYLRRDLHKELLKDLIRKLASAFIHLPCEMIELSIAFLLGQVALCSRAASLVVNVESQESLIHTLNINTAFFYISLFIIFPIWAFLTKLCNSMILDNKRNRLEHILGVFMFMVLCALTIVFMVFSLKNNQ